MAGASNLLRQLRTIGSDLPRDLAAQIVALGDDATPFLLHLVDGSQSAEDGEAVRAAEECADCGQQHDAHEWARLHAVDLLAELRAPASIETMLRVLESTESDEPIHEKIVEQLPHFGGDATEAILAALARTTKETRTAESLCCILSALGVRDPRILRALLDLLTVRPRAAAFYLADYGDAAAAPRLLEVIAELEAKVDDASARTALPDLAEVFTSLGGELPASLKTRIDALHIRSVHR